MARQKVKRLRRNRYRSAQILGGGGYDSDKENESPTPPTNDAAKPEIVFLGHSIKDGNIMPNPASIRGLLHTKSSAATKETFRSVKAAEYYRKFISHFFQIAGPPYKYAPTTAQQCDKRSQSSKIVLSLEVLLTR
ncbi:unnamed protein product [Didymodactylos carnosus]|uniref:Uncharacterized protein n=1 Tax=Didymodactylos carnosus TaxID=1234261 RepID=A0A816F6F9_9BILA|nr:unnamed protein product [Didymodactylos carnosus]CAF4592412.1 unnamed protein product [Didymodactylos carnosus]